jgi:dATP pyrophosphohydrolase
MPYKIPRSVLVVIHTPALEVLMMERALWPGFWQSVTGSLDALDEPLAETARREVGEETGIDTTLHQLRDWQIERQFEIFPRHRSRYAPEVTHNREHWFGLTVPTPMPVTLAPAEHLRYEWLPWREAAERTISSTNREAILMLPDMLSRTDL